AEAAKKIIPREVWEAAQRFSEVSDRLRLVQQQVVGGVADRIRQANQQVSEMVRSLMRPAFEVVDVFRSPEIQDLIKRAREALARWPAATRYTLYTLGMNGWYPDDEMDMSQLLDFAKGFDIGEEQRTNEMLCQRFEARSEGIINDLI